MPRYVANDSEDDYEPKTGRKTRAAVAAAVTDSPIRRSTRNRHGSVNPDGSSPESITGPPTTITTRVTRRRGAAAAATDLTSIPEPPRALRSRRNSASSNISENLEPESAPGTPRTRAIKRLSIVESSPGTPKLDTRTRRSTRASSETKTPPPPVRATRRTRATSIDPEPSIERVTKSAVVSTPTKKRRQPVSALPTEPVLTEEDNEDKIQQESEIDKVEKIPEEEIEHESSPDKTLVESSSRSPSPSSKKSPKKDRTDAKQEDDENPAGKSPEKPSATEILSVQDKFRIDEKEEAELLKTPEVEQQAEVVAAGNIEAQNSPKLVETSLIKAKRNSLDKSRELGMKIEDLLNKSTEEQEKSPGNKENEKLNVSPEKVKKNLEFTVSNVNISRGKSLGAPRFSNKSGDKKMNSSLDERVLSKSRFDIVASKSLEVEDSRPFNTSKNSQESNSEKKSQSESSNVVKSAKKNGNQEAKDTESAGDRSDSKTSYTKVAETIVENEIIEEFTLDDSESEFSLTVDDDGESEKKNTDQASQKQQGSITSERSDHSESSSDIFNVPKNNSRKNSIDGVEERKQDAAKKRASLNSKEAEESSEVSKADKKQDKRRESTGKIDSKETDVKTKDLEIKRNSEKDIEQEEEAMDTNEHEEAESKDESHTVSPEKKEVESLKVKDSKNEVSDSDSNIVIDNLFQNISAEEWNKKKGKDSPKEDSKKKRKSSLKGRVMSEETDSDGDLLPVSEKSRKGGEASDSDDTLILKKNDSPKKANKKKKSDVKPVPEQADSEDEPMEVSVESKKSPNKSRRSNTSVGNKSNDKVQVQEEKGDGDEKNDQNSEAKSQDEGKEGTEIEDDISEAETIPSNTENMKALKENSAGKDIEEEEEPASTESTAKKLKKKSKKSADVYEFENSSGDEELDDEAADDSTDEEEKTEVVNSKLRSRTKKRLGLPGKEPRTPMDRNYSTVAVVDSESDSAANLMPGYLFSVDSSEDEDFIVNEKDNSTYSIDSDVAREMNLAGKDDLEYSDDNVIADDCHASESEYSDEDDAGSDLNDFVVPDDEDESVEISEEETSPRAKFKRILDKSSSEEEEDDEEIEEKDEESPTKKTDEKLRRNSLRKTSAVKNSHSLREEPAEKSPQLLAKRLNFSLDSDVSAFSNKKTKKGKIVPDLTGESEVSESPGIEEIEKKSIKKLAKFSKPLRSVLDTTIDLCTPETRSLTQTKDKNNRQSPGLNNSLSKRLRKNLVEDLGSLTPEDSNKTKEDEDEDQDESEDEEEKLMFTTKTKTPNKEKKTPNKSQDSNKTQEDETDDDEDEEEEESVFVTKTKTPIKEKKTPNKSQDSNKTQEDETDEDEEDEEDELVFIPRTKTPVKEKKTPKKSEASNKTQEDEEYEDEEVTEKELVFTTQKRTPNKEKKTPNKEKKTPHKEKETPNKEKETPNKEEKTPNKTDKKTPKSGKKNTRDSMQLIEATALIKSSVSDLNKSMLTPNSESPVTKFLKKERLNESLPLLELKKRVSKTFDRKTLNKMDEDEQETDDASETEEPEEANEESGDEENNENDDVEEIEDEVIANGHQDDEDEDGTDKEEENGDVDEEYDQQLEDEESEESSDEMSKKRKKKKTKKDKTPIKAVKTPEIRTEQKSRKSGGRKSLSELEIVANKNGGDITPNKKDLAKRLSTASVTGKNTESKEDIVQVIVSGSKKRHLSTPGSELKTGKKRARLETGETPVGPKDKKRTKTVAKAEISSGDEKDDDEAPESLGFGQARSAALQEMKDVASSLKAAKEAKKKKRRDQLERIKAEKEAKMAKKPTPAVKTDPETAKTNLKRLPEELLDNLTDEPQRPKKKRKLSKKEEKIVPSRFMFSPGKASQTTSLKVENQASPLSTVGATTHFSVINLEKVKKQPKKAAAVASFRDIMLARNPRQPVSAFLMYKAKQKASGKQLSSRKQA